MAHPVLEKQNEAFQKQIVKLSNRIAGAIGFAASNCYMIEAEESLIIIDTTESTGAAENILAEFRRISDKPVSHIIYTHSHRDHISGASVFAEGGAPEIIASHRFQSDLVGADAGPAKSLQDRTRKQFGFGLSFPDERINLGLGPGDRPMKGMGAGHIAPTRLIDEDRFSVSLAGVTMDLIHAPGETPDHLMIYLPEQKLLFSGDNYYQAFPNLYAIRGTPYRDFASWADTLDQILSLDVETLAPGHTMPVTGSDDIRERLTDYRDAIRHIMAASAEAVNNGASLDDLGRIITLPGHLKEKPWLQEVYGKVGWAAKAYLVGKLGWFDGNPTNLDRFTSHEEAGRMIALAGGADAILQAIDESDDPQWTLQLTDWLLAVGEHEETAKNARVKALRQKAEAEINATARNYYLVSAKDLEGQ